MARAGWFSCEGTLRGRLVSPAVILRSALTAPCPLNPYPRGAAEGGRGKRERIIAQMPAPHLPAPHCRETRQKNKPHFVRRPTQQFCAAHGGRVVSDQSRQCRTGFPPWPILARALTLRARTVPLCRMDQGTRAPRS